MMETKGHDRKALKGTYKERVISGGVGVVRNTVNGKLLIESAIDIASKKNRFDFGKSSGLCIYPRLQKDWDLHGPDAFEYEVLERLEKTEDQSMKEFSENVSLLEQIWLEKTDSKLLY